MDREFWWIHSARREEWAGLRVAVFLPVAGRDGDPAVIIQGDSGDRLGLRAWSTLRDHEGFVKVARIAIPTEADIRRAGMTVVDGGRI